MNDENTNETEETEATTTGTGEREGRAAETVSKATEGLLEVGRLWAAYGLDVGRSALEASAATLRTTAGVLGAISERFARDDEGGKAA